MSSSQTLAKAVKVEWQNRVASLYWRVLGELHLLGRWIPVEESALVKTRFVEQAFRASLIGCAGLRLRLRGIQLREFPGGHLCPLRAAPTPVGVRAALRNWR